MSQKRISEIFPSPPVIKALVKFTVKRKHLSLKRGLHDDEGETCFIIFSQNIGEEGNACPLSKSSQYVGDGDTHT